MNIFVEQSSDESFSRCTVRSLSARVLVDGTSIVVQHVPTVEVHFSETTKCFCGRNDAIQRDEIANQFKFAFLSTTQRYIIYSHNTRVFFVELEEIVLNIITHK